MRELEEIDHLIRWYMEDFAVKEPFETTKAERASQSLHTYASRLLEALGLKGILPEQNSPRHLVVQINSSTSSFRTFSGLRWEVLQSMEHFPKDLGLASISTVRLVNKVDTASESTATMACDKIADQASNKLNILAITARPRASLDIPHRLITKSIYEVVEKVNGEGTYKINFKISRPGSFKALKEHLKMEPSGFYGIVHLDLHGVVEHERAFAVFEKEPTGGEDPVSAETLAEELTKHGVEIVVLNACQSALEGHAPEANLARTLVQYGINTTIAMSFNVLDYTAMLFMRVFYQQLFSCDLEPLLAMQAARQQLIQDRSRMTNYATEVTVDDYLVPVIYQNKSPDISFHHFETLHQNLFISYAKGVDNGDELIGRESELLDLERALLMQSSIASIEGPPGIGKSALVESASVWWQDTLLVNRCVHIEVSTLHSDSLLSVLYKKLGMKVEGKEPKFPIPSRQKAMIQRYFEKEKILVLFDGVETTGPDKVSENNLLALVSFLVLLQKIQKTSRSKSYVLLTSRKLPDRSILKQTTRLLKPLKPAQTLDLSTRILKYSHKIVEKMSWEELMTIEQFGELVQGNPLALRLLLHSFCRQDLNVNEYLSSLFSGNSIMIDEKWLQNTRGSRSIFDVRRLLQDSDTVVALLPFWETVNHQTLKDYFEYIAYDTRDQNSSTYKLRECLLAVDLIGERTMAELDILSRENVNLQPGDEVDIKGLVRPFLDELYIDDRGVRQSHDIIQYRLHPLIPLVIRDQSTQGLLGAKEISRKVIPRIFCYRVKSWPITQFYFKPAWKAPTEIIKSEFYNFLSAAYYTVGMEQSVFSNCLLILVTCISGKGIAGDRGRHALYATFLKVVLARAEDESARLIQDDKARPKIVPTNDWLMRLIGLGSGVRYLVGTLEETIYNLPALCNNIVEIFVLMGLCDYYSRNDDAKIEQYLVQMEKIYDKRPKLPGIDSKVRKILELPIKGMVSSGASINPLEIFSKEQLGAKAEFRSRMYSGFQSYGLDISGYDEGQLLPGLGTSGVGNAFVKQDENMYVAFLKARETLEQNSAGSIAVARDILLQALVLERGQSPKPVNMAAIHKVLSEAVEEKAGHWGKALYHWNEALKIEREAQYPKSDDILAQEARRTEKLKEEVAAARILN